MSPTLDINALMAHATFEKRARSDFDGEVPLAFLQMVERAAETRERVTLPANSVEAFEDIKALVLTAARSISRSAWVGTVHPMHTVHDEDGNSYQEENKAGKIVGVVFTVGAKRGPKQKDAAEIAE